MNATPIRWLAIGVLSFYKKAISPWLPAACRFTPTCSEYASAAIERYGVCRGALKSLGRLLRCQPLCSGGFDPLH